MVKEEEDHRYDKLSDYSILKVLNEVTHVIIEVKESIGTVIGKAMRNEFAQLFLEATYCYDKEQRKEMYGQILCMIHLHYILSSPKFQYSCLPKH